MTLKVKPPKKPAANSKGAPPASPTAAEAKNTHGFTDKADNAQMVAVNYSVTEEFRREYKLFAAMHGMTMTEVLKESFELIKKAKSTQ
jgi:hypothetical protein